MWGGGDLDHQFSIRSSCYPDKLANHEKKNFPKASTLGLHSPTSLVKIYSVSKRNKMRREKFMHFMQLTKEPKELQYLAA